MLDALADMRQGGAREIAQRTGLQRAVVMRALGRLVELDYAAKGTEHGRAIYRARRALD